MKKTWVVFITEGVGHELNGSIYDCDWYGPFTEADALVLEGKLNEIFDAEEDIEHPIACSMPLQSMPMRDVIRLAKVESRARQS